MSDEEAKIEPHDDQRARLARHLGERVPLSGDASRGIPVFVPRWVVLVLRTAAVLLAVYLVWRLVSG